jgi:hypothetical protein
MSSDRQSGGRPPGGEPERELLTRALRERSRHVDGHGVGIDDVLHTARNIRRRRMIGTGAAAAVVVAIAAPVALTLAPGTQQARAPIATHTTTAPTTLPTRSPQPSPTLTPTLTPTRSPSVTVAASPTTEITGPAWTLDPAKAHKGLGPTIDWAQGDVIHGGYGGTTTVPGRVLGFGVANGGYLVRTGQHTSVPGAASLVTLDTTGKVVSSQPTFGDLAVSQDSTQTAWSVAGANGKPGEVFASGGSSMSNSGPARHRTPPGYVADPVGFISDGELLYTLQRGSAPVQLWTTRFDGHAERLPLIGVTPSGTSEMDGLIAVNDQNDSCGSVYDSTGTTRLWHTCNFTLGRFSPDGQRILALPSGPQDTADLQFAVLDAKTGKVEGIYRSADPAGFQITDVVWENGDLLLAVGVDQHGYTMYRIGLTGSMERLEGPISVSGHGADPWVFTARP